MFKDLKIQLQVNFSKLSKDNNLFYVSIDRTRIWDEYLNGFSDLEERQVNNCNCCKSFLRQWGGIVAIVDNKRVSIWDGINVDGFNESVQNVLAYVNSLPITDIFYNEFSSCGTDKNLDTTKGVLWEHFHLNLPSKFVKNSGIDTVRGEKRTQREVLKNSLNELTLDSTETVLEVIAQNSLYRGKEFEGILNEFRKVQLAYNALTDEDSKSNFIWVTSTQVGPALNRIKNTAIGTLLGDLSEGVDLEKAINKFERGVMAPTNYKRPTALITSKMIEQAKSKLTELGLIDSLERRFANEADLNLENVIYIDKSSQLTDLFSEMSKETLVNPKTFNKVDEININDFIEKVVPTAKSIEVLLENSHLNNMVSLVTAQEKDSPSLFKWDNNFSWCYTGGVTDSIKEKVKAAGGNVDGELRVSLSWFNYDDLDLHVIEPDGNEIYFSNKISNKTGGKLDVDMNAGGGNTRSAVENIIWTNKTKMLDGVYKVYVKNFAKRETVDGGYIVQIESNGESYDLEFLKSPSNQSKDLVIEFTYTKANGLIISSQGKSNIVSKDKWNLKTNQFHKVKNLMISPNQWGSKIGNKHYFLTLENCVNDEAPRPIFNEFLKEEFNENRKVFEIMGSKIKLADTKNQLSGVGFSETQRKSFIVRVEGKFKRTLKVTI